MRSIEPYQIGLVFWAEKDAGVVLRQLRTLDIYAGQIGIPPELRFEEVLDIWIAGLNEQCVAVSSVVCSYMGEEYTNLKTIYNTVGFTTEAYRAERIERTKVLSQFAKAMGILAISCHIGFIPSNSREILYVDLCDLTKLLCDHCAMCGQQFVLETGQETADILASFIHNVDRPNLKVNFDSANMSHVSVWRPVGRS